MPTITVDESAKDWFDSFKGDKTQAEGFNEIMSIVKAFEGEPVDTEELADELVMQLGAKVQNNAYKGAKDAVESVEVSYSED